MDLKYVNKKKYLLENYLRLGLNEKQLVIVLLCLKDDVVFKIDYDKLKNCMNLSTDEVTNILSELIKANAISVTLEKSGDEYIEVIDCSNLFDCDDNVESVGQNIFAEIEIVFGKSLSSKEVDTISKWISVNKYTESDIIEAFGIAAVNNVKNLKYVEKVLENNKPVCDEVITPLELKFNWLEDE